MPLTLHLHYGHHLHACCCACPTWTAACAEHDFMQNGGSDDVSIMQHLFAITATFSVLMCCTEFGTSSCASTALPRHTFFLQGY